MFGGRKRISFALISHVCPSTKHCKEYSRLMERNPFLCVCVLLRDCYFHSSVYCVDYRFLLDCNPRGDRGEAYWIYSRGVYRDEEGKQEKSGFNERLQSVMCQIF